MFFSVRTAVLFLQKLYVKRRFVCRPAIFWRYRRASIPLAGDTAYGGFPLPCNQKLFLHALSLKIPADNPVGLPPEITEQVQPELKTFLSSSDCETGLLRL